MATPLNVGSADICPWGCVHAVECVCAAAKLHVWADSSEDEAPKKHTAGQDSCRPQLREGSPPPHNKSSLLGLQSRLPWEQAIPKGEYSKMAASFRHR